MRWERRGGQCGERDEAETTRSQHCTLASLGQITVSGDQTEKRLRTEFKDNLSDNTDRKKIPPWANPGPGDSWGMAGRR